jgi:phosphodiesterase/alkaline phosphatase D-like protein
MKRSKAPALVTASIALMLSGSHLRGQVSFPGPELLGRPTADSVTVNVVAGNAIDAYIEYGTQSGSYPFQTATVSAAANEPLEIVIGGLQSNTRYYYRVVYRASGASPWIARDEHTFHTQRSAGSTFTFTVASDSHINNVFGNPSLYQRTMLNVDADRPDFHLDLGDTFAMDSVTTEAQARNAYLTQRPYMGLMSHSAPVFLALGNHAQEEGWHLDDTGTVATSQPVLSANARKRYFLNPAPDAFYSGNTEQRPELDGDRLMEDYYAWTWGDALFVVIDPYWYTTTKPYASTTGGGESSDAGSGDRWDWTLGWVQYEWLKQTLETSDATFKFIFAHQGVGGTDDYGRGGANMVPYVEWGGRNENGTTWAFDTRRPGWDSPIHQMLVENGVTAFFHGHDHEFAYEIRDGVVYQLVPMAAEANYGYGFQNYRETDPYTIRVLPNSGHLRVTVAPSVVTVAYVRAFLPGAGTNGQVAYSYDVDVPTVDTMPPAISQVSASPASSTAVVTWSTDEAADSRVDYGPSEALELSASGAALVTAHSLTLSGLIPGTTYYYRVTSNDAGGNASTSPEGPPASFTTSAVTAVVAFPASVVIQSGTLRGGSAGSLVADDNVYYEVNSTTWWGTRIASAYASFTGVPNGLSNLKVSYSGKNSQTCSQTVAIWRWTTNSWVQLDSRSVGTAEVSIADLAPNGTLADFVSGTSGDGQLRVRVRCTRTSNFFSSWDLMQIAYTAP